MQEPGPEKLICQVQRVHPASGASVGVLLSSVRVEAAEGCWALPLVGPVWEDSVGRDSGWVLRELRGGGKQVVEDSAQT